MRWDYHRRDERRAESQTNHWCGLPEDWIDQLYKNNTMVIMYMHNKCKSIMMLLSQSSHSSSSLAAIDYASTKYTIYFQRNNIDVESKVMSRGATPVESTANDWQTDKAQNASEWCSTNSQTHCWSDTITRNFLPAKTKCSTADLYEGVHMLHIICTLRSNDTFGTVLLHDVMLCITHTIIYCNQTA